MASGLCYRAPNISKEKFEGTLRRIVSGHYSCLRSQQWWHIDVSEDQFPQLLKEFWASNSPELEMSGSPAVLVVTECWEKHPELPGQRTIMFWNGETSNVYCGSGLR